MERCKFLQMHCNSFYSLFLCTLFVFIPAKKIKAQERFLVQFDTVVLCPKLTQTAQTIGNTYHDTLILTNSHYFASQDSMFIYFVDMNTKQQFCTAFSTQWFAECIHAGSFSFSSVVVGDDFLLLTDYKTFFWFHRNGVSLTPDTVISDIHINGIRSSFFLPSGKVLIFGNHLPYKGDESKVSTLMLVDPKTKQKEKTIHPDFVLPFLTYYTPRTLVSLTDTSILYAQAGEYRITEYDFNLNPVDTLLNSKIKWHPVPEDTMRACFNEYEFAIDRLWAMNSWHYRANILRFVYAGENDLWVFYTKKGKEPKDRDSLFFDIWEKQHGRWVQRDTDLPDAEKEKKPFGRHRLQGWKETMFRHKKQIARVSGFLTRNAIEIGGLPYDEWKKEKDKYLLDDDYVIGVEFFNSNP